MKSSSLTQLPFHDRKEESIELNALRPIPSQPNVTYESEMAERDNDRVAISTATPASACTSSADPLNKTLSQEIQTHDGVFSNMSARPQIMVLPKGRPDSPPPYESLSSAAALDEHRPYAIADDAQDFDEVLIDGVEVGSYLGFVIYCTVSILFEFLGFVLCYGLSTSHAARLGSVAGLGITVALQSTRLSDLADASEYWREHREYLPTLAFVLAFCGYVLFLYGLFAYQRLRTEARERLYQNRST